MQIFDDFPLFVDFLNKDARIADFNPVRFINVETMKMWGRVKSFLTTNSKKFIRLSDFCQNEDIAPNMNLLRKEIRLTNASTLVTPLSEYLRINRPIANKMIYDILHANFENNHEGKLRVYILLYRMKDILSNLELSPNETKTVSYINESSENDYSLTIVQKNFDFSIDGNVIDGFKKYLIYWEQNPDKPIILCTMNAINYSDIVFSDNVMVIVSAYDLLRQYFGMPNTLNKELGTDEQWSKLASEYSKVKNLDLTMCTLLSASKYNDNLFENWNTYDSLKQWLLWIWARLQTKIEYLKISSNNSKSVHDFENIIFIGIVEFLDKPRFSEFYEERKVLLNAMKLPVTNARMTAFDELDPLNRMRCLTDRTLEEKQAIIKCFSEVSDTEAAEHILESVYPLAYYYLQNIGFNDTDVEEYFKAYRRCKITNKGNDSFINMVNMIANEHGTKFWGLPSRNTLVEQQYADNTIILFVDALGAEYVSALKSGFDENVYDIDIHFGHSNLPSTTERNNDFYKGKNHATPYYDLDSLKHSNCIYPQSVVQELDHILEIQHKIKELLAEYDTVMIASDHGSSRLAVLYRGESFDTNETAERYKYGRYCVDSEGDYSASQGCIRYDTDDKSYWIFANYNRFKQKGAPVCEIHGGASLEEMIVPVFCVSKKGTQNQFVVLTILTSTIKMSIDKKVMVRFKANQKLRKVVAVVDNKRINCSFTNGTYTFEQHITDNKTEYSARIISDNRIVGEIGYKVIHGMQKSTKFDI
ncbi:hypothetical protein JCM17380_45300 [Desulfosporosinus burensis]